MATISANATIAEAKEDNVKKAVPIILLLFLLCLVIDNSFKIISVDMAKDFHISATAVSWQATLAGLVIGIGAVVYATLADSISLRKLFSVGIILICAGSVLGYIFQQSFLLVVVSRIIQTAGLASAETLYVIFVTKHLPANEQKKFLGLSTSKFCAITDYRCIDWWLCFYLFPLDIFIFSSISHSSHPSFYFKISS